MEEHIERKAYGIILNSIRRRYRSRTQNWEKAKAVCVIEGLMGSGKTSFVLDYFRDKEYFYFSFAGLGEDVAELLFAEQTSKKAGIRISGWEDSFNAVSAEYKFIILDDLESTASYKRFHVLFYNNMITCIKTRPFIVLITQPTDDIAGLADAYDYMSIDYFTLPDVIKLFPELSHYDVLRLCAVSGGIPKLLSDYNQSKPFNDILCAMLRPTSSFVDFMPELLSRYFRRPENYHYILNAIAHGTHSISEIGKFTGFAYNKCDNYLAGLIDCGIVEPDTVISKRGAEKTAYTLRNNYFKLWYRYIYMSRTELQLESAEVIKNIILSIIEKEVHAYYIDKAIAYVNRKLDSYSLRHSFNIIEKAAYSPQTVNEGDFSFTFDSIVRNDNKAVLVRVLENPQDNCGRETFESIRRAVSLANIYYDSRVLIFAKHRFSDYAVKEASADDVVTLVRIWQLG